MYEVDPKTLLFSNRITWPEARELATFCQNIVVKGLVDGEHPAYKAWLTAYRQSGDEASKDESRMMLMTYRVVFPQRALLSLVILAMPDLPRGAASRCWPDGARVRGTSV